MGGVYLTLNALLRNKGLQCTGLRVLRISKIQNLCVHTHNRCDILHKHLTILDSRRLPKSLLLPSLHSFPFHFFNSIFVSPSLFLPCPFFLFLSFPFLHPPVHDSFLPSVHQYCTFFPVLSFIPFYLSSLLSSFPSFPLLFCFFPSHFPLTDLSLLVFSLSLPPTIRHDY